MKIVHQEQTQCPSCGHTHIQLTFDSNYVEYFKSGKNKGKVKHARPERQYFTAGQAFDVVSVVGANSLGVSESGGGVTYTKRVVACPRCRTIFVDDKEHEHLKFKEGF